MKPHNSAMWIPLAIAVVTTLGGIASTLLTADRGQGRVNAITAQRVRDSLVIEHLTDQLAAARLATTEPRRRTPTTRRAGATTPTRTAAVPTAQDTMLAKVEILAEAAKAVPDTVKPAPTLMQRFVKPRLKGARR